MINIRTPEEIEKIARAGKLTADTLSFLAKNIKPGGYKLREGLVIAIEPWFLKTTDEIFQDLPYLPP